MDADKLVFDFALVMVLLLIAPLLSMRLRLPDIAGLILAGVLVGEYGLGLFRLDTTFLLLGKVGLLYLMFLAGLEINLNDFQRYRKPSLVFGVLTFLIPQVLGALGARWLLGFSWPQAILLASMFASHTLIPFPIVQRLGLGRNRSVTTTIGGTILTDTAALLVLAVIVKGGTGVGVAFWSRLVVSLAALVFGSIFLLPRLGYWFFRRAAPDGAAEFIFVLAATFLVSYASELAGVEPIIGAFLAGLALSPIVPGRGVLMSRLHFVGHALFIPFFLLSVGMRVNLGVLFAGLGGWVVALYMVIVVTATKWLAARLSGKALGYSRDETGLLFGLSINQAAATLAAVLVGTRVGLFGDAVLNGTILMILVTCLIGPWWTERCAKRIAAQEAVRPSALRRESGRALVAISDPRHSDAIMDLAMLVRPDRCEEPIYPIRVAVEGPDDPARVAEAERLLAGAVARAEAADVDAIALARLDSNAAGGILRAAMEFRVSTIVMGWPEKRLAVSLLQSVPDRVITQSRQAVLLYRSITAPSAIRRLWVLAPPLIEHHPGFPNALAIAKRIAGQAGARFGFAATEKTHEAVTSLPGKKPGDKSDSIAASTWIAVCREVERVRSAGDGVLLLSARRGNLAWQPSLDRLPLQWAERWPDAELLVLYPPLPDSSNVETAGATAEGDESGIEGGAKPVAVHVNSAELGAAIREILRAALPECGPRTDVLADQLAQSMPVPLSADIALLHIHTPLVVFPRIAIGHRPDGFAIEGGEAKPTELALLLSPESATPEEHLRVLAGIARAAHRGTLL